MKSQNINFQIYRQEKRLKLIETLESHPMDIFCKACPSFFSHQSQSLSLFFSQPIAKPVPPKGKKLSNVRTAGSDDKVAQAPAVKFNQEEAKRQNQKD